MKSVKRPKISIIVAMYNGERYIQQCLDSIIDQEYENLEIILIDDGSPDKCGLIGDSYAKKDKRIQVIHHKNEGVSVSRNIGIEKSTGDYICIIDQDDYISKDYIKYFYNLIKNNNADIALTPAADKFFGRIREDKTRDKVEVWSGEKTAIEMLYHKIIIAPWNKMIKRELLIKNNVKFYPELFGGEGFAFSVQAYQYANRVAVGHRKVYHYRVGDPESGASKFRLSSIESSIHAQQLIKKSFVKETPELLEAWKFSNWHTYCDCLNMMVGCKATKQYPKEYEMLKKVCKNDALCALNAPVSLQQKLRGILFKFSPYMAAIVINFFRKRKFLDDNKKSE